jgi:hypothetical protein
MLVQAEVLDVADEALLVVDDGRRTAGGASDLLILSHQRGQSGLMFWFSRKKFVGSYARLSALSRSYFSAP